MPKTRPFRLPMQNCRKCNRRYQPKRVDQVYCSAECRKEDQAEKFYKTEPEEKVCKHCGSPFLTTAPNKQDYCTSDCQREEARGRAAEVRRKAKEFDRISANGTL